MARLSGVPRVVVGGICVDALSRKEWSERIVEFCLAKRAPDQLPMITFAANGQVIALYATNASFRYHFNKADAINADGQPMVWASRMTTCPLPERAATTDLFHDVARAAELKDLSFYLLGATEKSNCIAASRIQETYPSLRIVGRRNGYFSVTEETEIVDQIRAVKPDILWVGMGVGRQEQFVTRNVVRLSGVQWVLTCGGLLDYFTDEVKRAPKWVQEHSLEWLFRTWQEPQKYLLRYVCTNPIAAWLLLTRTRSLDESRLSSVMTAIEPKS